jgi:hypothetical protein
VTASRCPSCGALVSAGAEWCGQCFARLDVARSAPAAGTGAPGPVAKPGAIAASTWRCPTCGTSNDLEADACQSCGTPFGRLFEEPDLAPSVSPVAAAAWSVALPGLGHWFAGRRAEAVARFVLAAWVGGMLAVLLASRGGRQGLGPLGGLVALFAVAAVALWVEAAVDARRAVEGTAPLVSSRAMLWAAVALVGLSILLATVLSLSGLRPGPTGPVE